MIIPASTAADKAEIRERNAQQDKPAALGTKRSASETLADSEDAVLLEYELRSPFAPWGEFAAILLILAILAIATLTTF